MAQTVRHKNGIGLITCFLFEHGARERVLSCPLANQDNRVFRHYFDGLVKNIPRLVLWSVHLKCFFCAFVHRFDNALQLNRSLKTKQSLFLARMTKLSPCHPI